MKTKNETCANCGRTEKEHPYINEMQDTDSICKKFKPKRDTSEDDFFKYKLARHGLLPQSPDSVRSAVQKLKEVLLENIEYWVRNKNPNMISENEAIIKEIDEIFGEDLI